MIMKRFIFKNEQNSIYFLLFTIFYIQKSIGLVPSDLAIIIISQPNNFNSNLSNIIKTNLLNQTNSLYTVDDDYDGNDRRIRPPQILMTHEQFPKLINSWTIIGVLSQINATINENTKWIVFCNERCHIDLKILLENLENETNRFLGYPLYDKEPTIIHHFESLKSFFYPNLSSGIIFRYDLFKTILMRFRITTREFSIDPVYEMTKFIWDSGNGEKLTAVPYLCSYRSRSTSSSTSSSSSNKNNISNCAIHDSGYPKFVEFINLDKIIFTIKTCEQFHNDRMPVILSTWAKYVKHIRYYSDVADVTIPTIRTGIPNTDIGHCEKTFKIFEMVLNEIEENKELNDIEWIVLADDDTILSPSRLSKLLYHFQNEQHICLGERYGFGVHTRNGYNYITGGGGIIFKVNTLKTIVNYCYCPNLVSPDDMIIGFCLDELNIDLIHSPLFHQARQIDYAPETLLSEHDISFHKHWLIDPRYFYDKFFAKEDEQFYRQQINSGNQKTQNKLNDEF